MFETASGSILGVFFGLFLACQPSRGGEREDLELRRKDATAIAPVAAADIRASTAMAEADALVKKGDLIGAIDAAEKKAAPAIDDGVRLAGEARVATDWGRARRDALRAVLDERKAELGPYGEALRSGDAERLVAAMQAQAAIERRALAAARERSLPP